MLCLYTLILEDERVTVLTATHEDVGSETSGTSFRVLPHIVIVCAETRIPTLVNSGCEVSCINEEAFGKL